MKALFFSTSTAALALLSSPAMAASKIVTINELAITSGRFMIQVPAGDGVVLDLSEISQTVKGAAFGDATKFVISGIDGQLCYMQKDKCEATGASVISLRQVKGVEISTQSHSPDGSTTLTLTTDGKLGPKVLHMLLVPTLKAPYTAIVARKDFPPVQQVVASNTEKSPLEPQGERRELFLEQGEQREQGELRRKELHSAGLSIQSDSAPSAPSAPSASSASSLPNTYDHTHPGGLQLMQGKMNIIAQEPQDAAKVSSSVGATPEMPEIASAVNPHSVFLHQVNVSELPQGVNVTTTSKLTGKQPGRNHEQMQVKLSPVKQKSEHSDLVVRPEFKPTPEITSVLPPLASAIVNSGFTSANSDSLSVKPDEFNSVNEGYTVALGLLVAKKIGWISPQTIIWNKAQQAIAELLQGENRTDVLNKAQLDPNDFKQLLIWGESAISLLRQGENLASIADIVQTNTIRSSERKLLLERLSEWEISSL